MHKTLKDSHYCIYVTSVYNVYQKVGVFHSGWILQKYPLLRTLLFYAILQGLRCNMLGCFGFQVGVAPNNRLLTNARCGE